MNVKELKKAILERRNAIQFIQQQNKELIQKFPFIEKLPINIDSIRNDIQKYANQLIEIPNIPGKFLELPYDCYYEIVRYFDNIKDFMIFSLISKEIKLDNFTFKNIKFTGKCYNYSHIPERYTCNINHGKIYIKEYNSSYNHITLIDNIITINYYHNNNLLYEKIYKLLSKIENVNKPIINLTGDDREIGRETIKTIIKRINYFKIQANIMIDRNILDHYCHRSIHEIKEEYIDIYKLVDLMKIDISEEQDHIKMLMDDIRKFIKL